jgi:hypothetical protein
MSSKESGLSLLEPSNDEFDVWICLCYLYEIVPDEGSA